MVLRLSLDTGLEITSLSLGDVINVVVDYGKTLSQTLKLEMIGCSLISSTQSFELIISGLVNEESGHKTS